jgi:hypothetical protein
MPLGINLIDYRAARILLPNHYRVIKGIEEIVYANIFDSAKIRDHLGRIWLGAP